MQLKPGGNTASEVGPAPFDWWPDWLNKTVAIVGSGPSAKGQEYEQLCGRSKIIVINESYQLCPWADVLYGCDAKWWKKVNYLPEFKGLKITFDAATALTNPPIKWITVKPESDYICLERPGVVGSGGCSGFQALNLAIQFGASKILLIGFDMRYDYESHWHGRHPPPLNNPDITNYRRWVNSFDSMYGRITGLGVRVINCSPISALVNYPKMSIREALDV